MVLRGIERLGYSLGWRITDTEIEQTNTAAAAATTEAQRLQLHFYPTGRTCGFPKTPSQDLKTPTIKAAAENKAQR